MAKPWGKYELDFIDHPKFQALTTNAIALWWQVKNYCDKFHTDGFIPVRVVKGFRFYGSKAVMLLVTSCGQKPNGHPYSPLLDTIDIGGVPHYRMHDYLEHNDCREVVLKRLEQADARKEADRARKEEARAAKKAQLSALKSA